MKNSNLDGVHNEYYKMYNCCDASSVLWFIFGVSESGKLLRKLKPLLHKALLSPAAEALPRLWQKIYVNEHWTRHMWRLRNLRLKQLKYLQSINLLFLYSESSVLGDKTNMSNWCSGFVPTRHDICQKIYATAVLGTRILRKKTHKLQLRLKKNKSTGDQSNRGKMLANYITWIILIFGVTETLFMCWCRWIRMNMRSYFISVITSIIEVFRYGAHNIGP